MTERSILITGASTGIGFATAKLLKSRGWRVLATARKVEDLDRLTKDAGVEALKLELTDEGSIAVCADEALRRTSGKLGALYNNAAYGVVGAMEDISSGLLRHHLEANVVGTHELTRRVVPAMRANGAGRIVFCSSVLGFVSGPYRGAYCMTKFAIEAMADAMRVELAGSGVAVSIIQPGPVETKFVPTALATFKANVDFEHSPHREAYLRRLEQMEAGQPNRMRVGPEVVAMKVAHAVESNYPKVRYRVTLPTHVAAVMKRVLPSRVLDAIVARW
jgi:NAD(P)-dependent dehydrogenase (short-subunit alcohol dehydrogenase family)